VDHADLEFDPAVPPSEPEADPFGEFEIPPSLVPPAPSAAATLGRAKSLIPPVVAELSLDFEEATPAPQAPAQTSAQASVRNPTAKAIPPSALRAPAVPDLEIPPLAAAPRAPVSGGAPAQRAVPAAASPAVDSDFTLEVDYGSSVPSGGFSQRSSWPPQTKSAHPSEPSARRSPRPSGLPPASPIPSPLPKVAQRPSAPPRELGLISDDWSLGLDELGGMGSARAAQLDVSVQLPKRDEVPWPVGRTPFDDELDVSTEAVARAGFGPAPKAFWGTPSYAWRVMRKQAKLSAQLLEAQSALRRVEATRDQKFGALAQFKRAEIGTQERFSSLYVQVDESAQALKDKTKELESLNEQGAADLRSAEQKLSVLHTRHSHLETEREGVRQRVDAQNTHLLRQNAAVKRLQIEERNLTTRFENDTIKEAQYRLHAADLAHRTELSAQEVRESTAQLSRLKTELAEADQQLRLAAADLQRQEGTIEAHLITLEGSGAEKSRSLGELKATHSRQLSAIGAAIVELRGQVPVDEGTRSELLLLEGQVKEAALAYRTLQLAQDSVDRAALRLGRGLWVAAGLALIILIVRWLAV